MYSLSFMHHISDSMTKISMHLHSNADYIRCLNALIAVYMQLEKILGKKFNATTKNYSFEVLLLKFPEEWKDEMKKKINKCCNFLSYCSAYTS
jgi:hypothetical protein